ncbi:MAG: Low temperature requirement protein LtrA [Bacteroidetes bacterium]|nr:Low temperature requirement protein LtrA [Bacteroidota bacterium]
MSERKAPVWWGIPKRFSERGKDRKISWLELFYDLVYAGAISQLTEHLARHTDLHALCYVFFLFAFLFWSWLNGSLYHDLHGNAGVRSRITTLWQMMAVAAVAVTLPEVFAGHHAGFAISFAVVQMLITYLWWSTGYYEPSHKMLNRWYIFNYSISFILLVVSAFTTYHTALILWVLALLSNLSAGILSSRSTQREMLKRGESFSASSSMIERFGLFTIIVLGEAILGIIHGIGACTDTSFIIWVSFVLSILVAFLLWWVYFDLLGESHAKPGYFNFIFLTFGYLPLLFSFAVIGAAMRVMLSDSSASPHGIARKMLGIAVAVILLSTVSISRIMEQDKAEEKAIGKILRLVLFTSAWVLVVTAISGYVSLPVYLGLIAATLLGAIALSFRVWLGYGLFSEE